MLKNLVKKTEQTTKDLLDKIGIDSTVTAKEIEGAIYIDVKTKDSALVIGYRGENLSCFEHIIKIILAKNLKDNESLPRIILDVGGYKKNRNTKISELATFQAKKVLETKRPEILMPMNAYERRLVHMAIGKFKDIITESVGEEPNRRIIIKIKD